VKSPCLYLCRGPELTTFPGVMMAAGGHIVFDADAYTRATSGERLDTVNPSLWRQSQLTSIQGLFEVTDRIYQVRGIEVRIVCVVTGIPRPAALPGWARRGRADPRALVRRAGSAIRSS
jgi:hypothetical protein